MRHWSMLDFEAITHYSHIKINPCHNHIPQVHYWKMVVLYFRRMREWIRNILGNRVEEVCVQRFPVQQWNKGNLLNEFLGLNNWILDLLNTPLWFCERLKRKCGMHGGEMLRGIIIKVYIYLSSIVSLPWSDERNAFYMLHFCVISYLIRWRENYVHCVV